MNKILIVEDTLEIREEIFDILTMEGYTIFEAENGKTGFEIALKKNPDLIVSDILMPEMNGFEMFEKLKNNKKTKSIPLIFISAKGEKRDIRSAMNLGAEDYLTKPVNVNDLTNAVKSKIKKKLIIDKEIINKTTVLSDTLKKQQQLLDNYSHLILDGIKPSQKNILELLAWTQQELEETNNFRDSNIKIEEKWSKLKYTEYKSINTNAIAKQVIHKIEKPSHIRITISTKLPHIIANEHMLEKVFEILIKNAIERIHKKIGLIEIGCKTTEKENVFSIKYNYIRINPKSHKKTFENFKTIKSSKSIGVGLNIVKKIITYHNGNIYI